MFKSMKSCANFASASCAAAASFCANLSVILDAALLASILFVLLVLDLHILAVLVGLVAIIIRIMVTQNKVPACKT